MNCKYHSTKEAHTICTKCKNPICLECTITIDDKTICQHCILENLFSESSGLPPQTFWQKALFLGFSLIPGAAHMSMGLFRRGLQLMIISLGIIFLSSFIDLDSLIPFLFVPTWFFSFFESLNLRKQLEKGQVINDQELFNLQLFDYTLFLKKYRLIGGIVIVIGLLGFKHVIESNLLYHFSQHLQNYYYFIKDSIIPGGLVLGGIYLIAKGKQTSQATQSSPEKPIIPDTNQQE